ncbi:hypothetical protein N7468_000468 [Penicillium chermesinum]|uniref:Enoyl reductase (ER) domain-containing protein n=1 Tax=Penicillium chermesinum TaxID=63820 RepID=A0A9W9PKD5_9EURO|nr:uncharacterized protein N7468_000468 [Penicillium chermesinum]KAJ5249017.1 hypothetical protein N7468_000468 [Penicillium chermesinum]KAJ6151125.1 hypothetical protein N7470_007719 [Penicillium chermesinum]
MATHLAAVSLAKGQPLQIQTRQTPKPGPDDLLVAVKSIALNPADVLMRDTGILVSAHPTILGFDVSGLVLEVGENVPVAPYNDSPSASFRPGLTRIAAYSACVWRASDPNYGVFQETCLVPWQHAVILPDSISWNHAVTLPVSVQVALCAWDAMGIPRLDNPISAPEKADVANKEEVLLVWGASSSVGSMGVQTARLLRMDPSSPFAAVYATAGATNHEYVASMGADRVFDYKDARVVDFILAAAAEDGLVIRHCFLATGSLALCHSVLKHFLRRDDETVTVASAPPVPDEAKRWNALETIFLVPSVVESERLEQFRFWLGTWLRKNLVKGTIVPSPEPMVVGRGIESLDSAMDKLREGVSCKKLVVEVAK